MAWGRLCAVCRGHSLHVHLQIAGSLHEHLDARHKGADLGEVALRDHLCVVGEASVVVILLDGGHHLVQALHHSGRQLTHTHTDTDFLTDIVQDGQVQNLCFAA